MSKEKDGKVGNKAKQRKDYVQRVEQDLWIKRNANRRGSFKCSERSTNAIKLPRRQGVKRRSKSWRRQSRGTKQASARVKKGERVRPRWGKRKKEFAIITEESDVRRKKRCNSKRDLGVEKLSNEETENQIDNREGTDY